MLTSRNRSINSLMVILIAISLTLIGLYTVYSSSTIWAEYLYGDAFYYTKKQILFIIIGLGAFWACSRLNLAILSKYSKVLLIISLILLGLVLIPGLGQERNGSQSWFGIGSFAVQPAEIFKLTMIIYAASVLNDKYAETKTFVKGILLPVLLPCFIGFGLIMLQPDFGTGVVMLGSVVVMTMISKTRISNYIKLGIVGVMAFAALIISAPYRLERITSFIDPWQNPLGSGFQIIQSLYAIGPGGILGLGINGSIQKHYYLPEPFNDFAFSMLAEEWGFIGGLIVIGLFAALFWYGFRIARSAKNNYRAFLATGITSLLAIQTIINLAVVVGLLPVTGITLPFISYGGSSLVITLSSVGVLVAVNREELDEYHDLRKWQWRSLLSRTNGGKRFRRTRS